MTFPNDDERRKHFLKLSAEIQKDPDFRKIEGFPIGEDEDIFALSDPPHYTPCPRRRGTTFLFDFGLCSSSQIHNRLEIKESVHRPIFYYFSFLPK
jgi:hypothetical protein